MKFKDFLTEKSAKNRKVIVVYGGGFQPFHQGHMSSYEQAKEHFPTADFYVASSSDVKVRPIPFADKKFLAEQAGVKDSFVQTKSPLNPAEITEKYDPKKDILILVRSERDPVPYKRKDGSAAYYQPFVSIDKCKSFDTEKGHGYIFVTKKKTFSIGKKEVYSGSQIREMYSKGNDEKRNEIIQSLYPKATKPKKIKSLLDKYIGGVKEDIDHQFSELLVEGVHDQAIFKAVFLAGGPGSGKDYVLSNTLDGHGLTEINSDKALEFLMDKKGLNKTMPDSEKDARDVVRSKAKNVTELKQHLALMGRNGLIINGTGDDSEKIKKIKTRLEDLGYDTSMILVNTSDEVSAARNIERGQRGGRTVPENIRKEKWDNVQKSRTELAKMFGSRYMEFDNTHDLRSADPEVVKAKKDEMTELFKSVREFVSQKPTSEKAQTWIAQELQKKDTLPIGKVGSEKSLSAHPDSKAAEEAKKLGLQYFGFGRYGKDGQVTHRSIHDSLVPVQKIEKMVAKVNQPKKKINEEFEMLTEAYSLSDSSALNLLLLGNEILDEEKKKEKYITDNEGKMRIFMLRGSAAKEAHTHNGEVVKLKKGYAVKLNEETQNVSISSQTILREDRGSQEGRTSSSSDSTGGEWKIPLREETRKKITLTEIRKNKKASFQEAIDKGIEPGLSMATSGENMSRGALKVKQNKKPLEELTGDETTMSIGDQKEDELKKKGISLSSFKAKKFIG